MCAAPNMTVFSSYLTSYFPATLLRHVPSNSEAVKVVSIITGTTFAYKFHESCISNIRSLYFWIFSASFLITFLSPEIATPINIHVPFSLSRIVMSIVLLWMVLSVCTYSLYNTVTFLSLLSTDLVLALTTAHCLNFAPISLHMLNYYYYYYYYYVIRMWLHDFALSKLQELQLF
jgi:hypothetical protein